MKKILIILLLCIGVFSINAETLRFQTRAYSSKTISEKGNWHSWSAWYDCDILITMDLNSDVVSIYSNSPQYYRIVDYSGQYMESGAQCQDYKFIDQDGDRGTMSLVIKPNGQSEIYIRFANVQWAYIVKRIN